MKSISLLIFVIALTLFTLSACSDRTAQNDRITPSTSISSSETEPSLPERSVATEPPQSSSGTASGTASSEPPSSSQNEPQAPIAEAPDPIVIIAIEDTDVGAVFSPVDNTEQTATEGFHSKESGTNQPLETVDSVCLELLSEAGLVPGQSPFGFSVGGAVEIGGREYTCVYLYQYNPQMPEQSLLLDLLYFDGDAEKLLVLNDAQQLREIENNRYRNAFSPAFFPTVEANAVYRDPANDAIVSSSPALPAEPILSEAEAAIILENYLAARGEWGESDAASPEGVGEQYGDYYYIVRQRVIHSGIAPTADEFYVNLYTGALYHANDFFSPEDDSISLCLYTD